MEVDRRVFLGGLAGIMVAPKVIQCEDPWAGVPMQVVTVGNRPTEADFIAFLAEARTWQRPSGYLEPHRG